MIPTKPDRSSNGRPAESISFGQWLLEWRDVLMASAGGLLVVAAAAVIAGLPWAMGLLGLLLLIESVRVRNADI